MSHGHRRERPARGRVAFLLGACALLVGLLIAQASAAASPTAYVANAGSGDVTPIDPATNMPGVPIPVGDEPYGIAITPDGARVYVTNLGTDDVTPIDLATNTPGTPIPVGTGPRGIAITPDGARAYVANTQANNVTPIELATNTPGTPIPVGFGPVAIAITPDGARAYVTNLGSNDVTPIELASNSPGAPIPVGDSPASIAVTPDGARAYVGNQGASDITPIDLAANSPGAPIPVGDAPWGIAITPDGARAYVTNLLTDDVTPIELATSTPGAPIPVGDNPAGIAITLDGARAYVTNIDANNVTPIDLASNMPGTPIPVGTGPVAIAITPPPPPPPPPPGLAQAQLAALGPPAGGGVCAPVRQRPAPAKGAPGGFSLSAEQFLINQRVYQAAIRRANAIEAWLSAGIEARDICGGALTVNRFATSVGFVGAGGARPVANPRPLQVAAPVRGGTGAVRVSRTQALINQRVAQAAILRANALGQRIAGQLTGGDIKDRQLSNAQLVTGLGFGAPGGAPKPRPSLTKVARRSGGDPGAVRLSASQLGINQRIGQQAVRRVNALADRLGAGLVAVNFAPGTIAGPEVSQP